MYLTNSEEARLLTLTMTGTRLALVTAQGTETAAGTEVSGAGYVRAAVTATTPDASGIRNAANVLFLDLPACELAGWELWSLDNKRRWFGYWAPTVALWGSDTFTTSTAHNLVAGSKIVFVLGQAPAGLVANTSYYVREVTSTTFKVSTTPTGPLSTVSGSGSTTFGRVLVIPAGESFQITTGNLLLGMD